MSAASFELKGWHVLAGVIAFFAVIFVANAVMITLAVRSFSGLEADNPYERGLAYNEVLEARQAQAALGWTVAFSTEAHGVEPLRLFLVFHDRDGGALHGLSVTGTLRRPATTALDADITFVEASSGAYVTDVAPPAAGEWELIAIARRGDAVFETRNRFWVE